MLALELSAVRFFLRVMMSTDEELKVLARVCAKFPQGSYPLHNAASFDGMDAAIVKLQKAFFSSVDAQDREGFTPIMIAVLESNPDNIHLLATMGTDLSIENDEGYNLWKYREDYRGLNTAKVLALLAKHGVKNRKIPDRFQSELYFKSTYYDAHLREQRWIARRALMMCLNSVCNWSRANQIESERLMTLPADLSSIGLFVARCWLHVDASGVDNGIARLIMEFAFGFNSDSKRLIGIPDEDLLDGDDDKWEDYGIDEEDSYDEEDEDDSYYDDDEEDEDSYDEEDEDSYYEEDEDSLNEYLDEKLDDEQMERMREAMFKCMTEDAVIQKMENKRKEANEKAQEEEVAAAAANDAAASLLAELDLEEKKELKKSGAGQQDSKKKSTKKKGGKKNAKKK
jgi:hypothetical protein